MPGYVYLVRNGDLHKIGRTDNLERRMQQLKPDEILQVLETDRSRDLEHELHEQFKAKRLPQTEYFRLDEAEVNLARLALGWQPGSSISVPPLHERYEDVAEARTQTNLAGLGVLGCLVLLGVEVISSAPDFNLLETLLVLATFAAFVVTSFALLGSTGTYAWRSLKRKVTESQ